MYGQDGDIVLRSKTKFSDPLKWVRSGNPPKVCFTCSWSDWFISEADEWRNEAWAIIRKTPQITYQILTKRIGRAIEHLPEDWAGGYDNVQIGVSVEKKDCSGRIGTLREIPAKVKFISFEPLLADVGLINFDGIDWCIVGGESGPGARPMEVEWARSILAQCRAAGVKFFMKQMGGAHDKRGSIDQIPEDLRIREFPEVKVTA